MANNSMINLLQRLERDGTDDGIRADVYVDVWVFRGLVSLVPGDNISEVIEVYGDGGRIWFVPIDRISAVMPRVESLTNPEGHAFTRESNDQG